MLTLSNPAGLFALLGIPAVIAIHFLQLRATVIPSSTLFLLEKTQREAAVGRRFDRLMPSIPLWMQLLGVLLLTWLLTGPRYQKERSIQRVAIVVDSSASMSVFREDLATTLETELANLQGSASRAEFTLLESLPGRPPLYRGESPAQLIQTLRNWNPSAGATDPTNALRLARSLVSREGWLIYATDTTVQSPPFDTKVLSVGRPIANVGFTSGEITTAEGSPIFRAILRNHSAQPLTRTWSAIAADGSTSPPREITLAPGAITTLQGALPSETSRLRLVLSPDEFTLDDTLCLIRPEPKSLLLHVANPQAFGPLAEKITQSFDAITPAPTSASADLTLVAFDPLDPPSIRGNTILFVLDDTQGGNYLRGGIVAEPHPLTQGLNWQGLMIRESLSLDPDPQDRILVRQGKRPLILLRESDNHRQLFFNFDLRLSNASQQSAFVVMLHRFAEEIRLQKISPASIQLETSQPIQLSYQNSPDAPKLELTASHPDGSKLESLSLDPSSLTPLHAPHLPGFLEIRQGDTKLLQAAIFFADVREADFQACTPQALPDDTATATLDLHTEEDPWWRIWTILLLAACLIAWHFTRTRQPTPSLSPSTLAEK